MDFNIVRYVFERKRFKLMNEYEKETAEITLSLDVIYHLIEDEIYTSYMELLFDSSTRFVIIYSSNTEIQAKYQASHVLHRNFSKWIDQNRPEWKLKKIIPNKYPCIGNDLEGSVSSFYIYEIN